MILHPHELFMMYPSLCIWPHNRKKTVWLVEGTLYCELGLGFNGGIGTVCHAGVDAGILFCEIGNLETAPSQQLHTTLTGDRSRERIVEKEVRKLVS